MHLSLCNIDKLHFLQKLIMFLKRLLAKNCKNIVNHKI